MTFICTTCDQTFEGIPEGAVRLTEPLGRRPIIYRFPDNRIHTLRAARKAPRKKQ